MSIGDVLLFPLSAMGAVFIISPFAALFPGVFFLWIWRRLNRSTALVAGALWLLYLPYEYLKYLRITCSGECNIRIDLLMIYPVLIVTSLLALFVAIHGLGRR